MKSYDYEAVVYDCEEYCIECLPVGVSVDSEDVAPIFADAALDFAPVCAKCGAVHDYMNLPPTPKFYRFEMREGDDNDVSVSEFFVRAQSEDASWSVIETIVRAKLGDRIWADDGDTEFWCVQFRSSDPCLVQDAPEACECDADHREFFANFRSMGEEETEPERALSMFHGWDGEWEAA